MPTAHLLCGFIGAGKTTFARQLEVKHKAVRFTHDEWMATLFGQDPPEELYGDYYQRIDALIWLTATRVLRAGSDVVLDFGFWSRESRDIARNQLAAQSVRVEFYYIHCPRHIMLERTLARSRRLPEDSVYVDESAHNQFLSQFEPMQSDEAFVEIDGAIIRV